MYYVFENYSIRLDGCFSFSILSNCRCLAELVMMMLLSINILSIDNCVLLNISTNLC
jgi:hypothetical protein